MRFSWVTPHERLFGARGTLWMLDQQDLVREFTERSDGHLSASERMMFHPFASAHNGGTHVRLRLQLCKRLSEE